MKKLILLITVLGTICTSAFANWSCHDGAGSSIQVIKEQYPPHREAYLNERVILRGPVVSQLFSDGHHMANYSGIHYNEHQQYFEFTSRGFGQLRTNRCTRGGFCAMTNNDYRGTKLVRPYLGDWYFGYCQ